MRNLADEGARCGHLQTLINRCECCIIQVFSMEIHLSIDARCRLSCYSMCLKSQTQRNET